MLLETERLIIRKVTEQDLSFTLEIYSNEKIMKYLGGVLSKEYITKQIFNKWLERTKINKPHFVPVMIALKETNEPIGMGGLRKTTREGETGLELGFMISLEFQHKGYASEFCRSLIKHAFDTLDNKRIISGTSLDNRGAINLLEKLGFVKFKEIERDESFPELRNLGLFELKK